jgi:type I restriction-modification system DNA methylase subunit
MGMSIEGILEQLDYKKGIIEVDKPIDDKLSTFKRHITREVNEFIRDIDHIYFTGDHPYIYFKSLKKFDKERIASIHKKTWNQGRVPFLFINTPTEIRIYDCFAPPLNPEEHDDLHEIELFDCSVHDNKKLQRLLEIFRRSSIESGKFLETEIAAKLNVQTKVDKFLIKNLRDTREQLEASGIAQAIIHDLLGRSLFTLYLEDRGATTPEFYSEYLEHAKSFFDILEDISATYKLFDYLRDKFNGDIFPVTDKEREVIDQEHLHLVKQCFWGDEIKSNQLSLWKRFDFSVIPIELLSAIYEEFLQKQQGKKKTSKEGGYYTPHSLVEFILNEQLAWADENNLKYNLKILDPACGSGIFLVEAYRRLVDRWQFAHGYQNIGYEDLKHLLTNSIFGIDINQHAIKVAAFSLYLAMLSYLEPKTIWLEVSFPYLINDRGNKSKKEQGRNLFRASTLSEGDFIRHKYDLVVGNPPFKRDNLPSDAREYCTTHGFAQELAQAFLHKAVTLCPTGNIALIAPSKAVLFNKSKKYQNFRKFLFHENYVEAVVNLSPLRKRKKGQGKHLFPSAIAPVCVIFYQKNPPVNPGDTLVYCVPKPTKQDQYVEGMVIDDSEMKYLPREECAKPDTNIWKVAMWATKKDFYIINRLSKGDSLNVYFDKHKKIWHTGIGLHRPDDNGCYVANLAKYPLIPTRRPERYYTKFGKLQPLGMANYRKTKEEIFQAPLVIVKEGQKQKRFCASYVPFNAVYRNAIYGIAAQVDPRILKTLVAYANSKLATYMLFLTASTWGIERERVVLTEFLSLPALPFSLPQEDIQALAKKVDLIIELKKAGRHEDDSDIITIENEIDEMIYQTLGISKKEQYLIEDVLNYSLDLFQEGEDSLACKPAAQDEVAQYTKMLCSELNDLLRFSGGSTWANMYQAARQSPLRLLAVHFSDEHAAGYITETPYNQQTDNILREVDNYTYQKYSESLYFRKIVKYYSGNTVYLIKPNEKRFWSCSMAMNDADDIIVEVLNAG